MGTNSLLPASIRVKWARTVPQDFHARFSAVSRRYYYLIYESSVGPALLHDGLLHMRRTLNVEAMHLAGQYLLGEHDFSAYRAAGCQSNTPQREVSRLDVVRHRNYIVVDVQANAFLQHMVRNIVGMLLMVGAGAKEPEWSRQLLEGRDRTAGATTAPAGGLYFRQCDVSGEIHAPRINSGPPLFTAISIGC